MTDCHPARDCDLTEHRHRLAIWYAARAASRGIGGVRVKQVSEWIEDICLKQFVEDWRRLPEPQDLDNLHRKWRNDLIDRAAKARTLAHGGAAKLINCYLKVGVVCASSEPDGQVPMASRAKIGALHPPVDSILRDEIARRENMSIYPRTVGWSRLDCKQYECAIGHLKKLARNAHPEGSMEFWRLEYYWNGYRVDPIGDEG